MEAGEFPQLELQTCLCQNTDHRELGQSVRSIYFRAKGVIFPVLCTIIIVSFNHPKPS